jgi:four helix bundle protein
VGGAAGLQDLRFRDSAPTILLEKRDVNGGASPAMAGSMVKPYDIRKRATLFSNDVYSFCQRLLARSQRHRKLVDQLNDAAGSIGANLEEAQAAESKKDFIHKNGLALKEAREARYWLRLAYARERPLRAEATLHIDEASELVAIISAIILKAKSNPDRGNTI